MKRSSESATYRGMRAPIRIVGEYVFDGGRYEGPLPGQRRSPSPFGRCPVSQAGVRGHWPARSSPGAQRAQPAGDVGLFVLLLEQEFPVGTGLSQALGELPARLVQDARADDRDPRLGESEPPKGAGTAGRPPGHRDHREPGSGAGRCSSNTARRARRLVQFLRQEGAEKGGDQGARAARPPLKKAFISST